MIASIRHKALKNYWTTGQSKGLEKSWLRKLDRLMAALDAAETPDDLNFPGAYFHGLQGRPKRYSVRLTANWRLTFGWSGKDAVDVDLEDYH
ncbi:MAG: type II toxin-antitoxin system RelE/ParE family toxin [Devosiaceae bacterium]|nr:type II toxin-antitoxin system RelE/ParE family toxin [Devosiaceae bacterium MH13]